MSSPGGLAETLRTRVSGEVKASAPLGPLTTFRVGGPADVLLEAESVGDLRAVAEVVPEEVPVAVVGRGSNLLVSDEGFHGVVVVLGRSFRFREVEGTQLRLGGSAYLPAVAKATARHGLSGFEFAAEVPGSFGGAVRMNAGAHGRCMADVLVEAKTVDLRSGEERGFGVEDLDYGYRRSSLPESAAVYEGWVRLEEGDPDEVGEMIGRYLRWRRTSQPPGRNAGSIFVNPPDDAAGRLIEAAGMKGERVGSAEVSAVHANFICVDRGGSAADVWHLIRYVREVVWEREGVELHLEVRFLGPFPQVARDHKPEVEG